VKSKAGKKCAAPPARERQAAIAGRTVLMFVMVPKVHLKKRLGWRDIFEQLGEEWADLFADEVANAVNEAK